MAAPKLPSVELLTSDGCLVVTVFTMPWVKPPEGIIWGERSFFLRDGKYYEGLLWFAVAGEVVGPVKPAGGT